MLQQQLSTFFPSLRSFTMKLATQPVTADDEPVPDSANPRINLSLAPRQNASLNAMAKETGLPRTELVRHAIALLNVAMKARSKGFDIAMINDQDDVVAHIATTI
jgi:hypothetical protein